VRTRFARLPGELLGDVAGHAGEAPGDAGAVGPGRLEAGVDLGRRGGSGAEATLGSTTLNSPLPSIEGPDANRAAGSMSVSRWWLMNW